MKYNVDYFIKKFKAIPDKMWCINTYGSKDGPKCALGHCLKWSKDNYTDSTKESIGLINILSSPGYITNINDGQRPEFQQNTPKERILVALKDKKKETKE